MTNFRNLNFFYIPTEHTLRVGQLGEHEYFGRDFLDGKMTCALFRTYDDPFSRRRGGKLRAVWSWGRWDREGLEAGKVCTFEHTQTRRKTEMVFTGIVVDRETLQELRVTNPELLAERAPQWTLK